ncbi:MAG: YbaN family protein [Gammaproteobacteria bacterium]|nr:YbaN family protein [Gammaproteobacteria bacterium]
MWPFKTVYFIFGWLFLGAGVIGVFLPVLPTTPFMILALWMFSKSSVRFHNWLYSHRIFGPPLQKWFEYRVVPPVAKVASVGMMSLSYFYIVVYTNMPWWGNMMIGTVMLYTVWYILRKPSCVPE